LVKILFKDLKNFFLKKKVGLNYTILGSYENLMTMVLYLTESEFLEMIWESEIFGQPIFIEKVELSTK